MSFKFYCGKCNRFIELDYRYFKCPTCNAPLDLHFERPAELEADNLIDYRFKGIWRFHRLLPPISKKLSLGEGLTPLVERELEGYTQLFKLDYLNPSGSFKDRGSAIAVSFALDFNISDIYEDSSGNAGFSIALYSRHASLTPHIYVPKDAPIEKVRVLRMLNVDIKLCKDREEAFNKAYSDAVTNNGYYIGHLWNPIFIEGLKTIAYEVALDSNFKSPDHIFIPVGSGGLLIGVYRGFRELYEYGLIDDIPKIHSVEAVGYVRVYTALKSYASIDYELNGVSKYADGIRVKHPPRLAQVIEAVKSTDGEPHVVNDSMIKEAIKALIKMGFIVEPTSATAYAAYINSVKYGIVDRGERSLIILTGSGFKTIANLLDLLGLKSKNR